MASVSRKCVKCGTWNGSEDFCKSCGNALSPQEVQKEEEKKRKKLWVKDEPSAFDLFLERIKTSRNPFVMAFYYICFALWSVYMAILSFILFLIAATPG